MIVYERAIPNNEGVFTITLRHPGYEEKKYLGKEGLYARYISNTGEIIDRFDVATVPVSANNLDKRALPETVFGGNDGRTICSFTQNSLLMRGRGVMMGVLNVITGEILAEESYMSEGDPMLAMASDNSGFIPSRILACSNDSDKALIWNPNGLFAVQLAQGLPRVMGKTFKGADPWFGSWINDCWVICPEHTRKQIVVIKQTSGEVVQEFKVRRTASSFAVAHSANKLAVGLMGGAVYVFDIIKNAKKIVSPHPDANKDDWALVKISDDGRYLVSKILENPSLMLTDLETNKTIALIELPWVKVPLESGGRHEFIPDFSFVGNELITLSNGEVTRYNLQ